MNKLKKKVFFTIFTLLSLFTITILFIYNYQNYNQEYNYIKNSLRTFNGEKRRLEGFERDYKLDNPPEKPDNNNADKFQMMVMDKVIYSVTLNDDKEILNITSHNLDETDVDKIKEVAQKIIDGNNTYKVGSLYTNRYSYRLYNDTLIIIDNKNTNTKLTTMLEVSLLILFLIEIVIIIITKIITNWIIKPVINSFNKQKQFVADASHELKTPLSVIMASSEAIDTDEQDKKWVNNIRNESERMSKLITNLLDLAKLENDNIKREYEKNNLSKIVEKSVLTFESVIFEKNIKLDYDIEENVYYNCNVDEIKQVISVVLDNATKHCNENGTITVNLKSIKDEIIIDIKNTGDPIPKGEEEKIFERFYRIDKARNRNENRYGLGLAIAKQIVENHKGKIYATSSNGITTFTIKFKKK